MHLTAGALPSEAEPEADSAQPGATARRGGLVVLVSPSPVDCYPPVEAQATILASLGHRVHLLTAPRAGRRTVHFSQSGVAVEAFPTQAASGLMRRAALAALAGRLAMLRRARPVLEVDYDPVGIVVGGWAGRLTRRRAAVLVHHHHEILFPDAASRFNRPARLALPQADLVVVADAGRARLIAAADPPPRRVLTVRNATLAGAALAAPADRHQAFSVVYFGSIGRTQALDTAIRSMPDWPGGTRLHLYGTPRPEIRAELLALAASLGVAERVMFESWIPADLLLPAVARHHLALTLLRPLNDNWRYSAGASNKRFQAMAAGLPQVSDDGIGIAELVEAAGVGVCVPPDDAAALARAVAAYAADPARVEAEGARGRALVAGGLNYEAEFHKVLAAAGLAAPDNGGVA